MENDKNTSGVPVWVLVAAVVAALLLGRGNNTPEPQPPGPEPVVVKSPAAEYFRSEARLMESIWTEAADKAEAGDFPTAVSARDWLADRVSKAREAALAPVAAAEDAALPGDNWDGAKAAALWRGFASQVKEAVP